MTGKEAFLIGFLQRCAEDGLSLQDMEKHAEDLAAAVTDPVCKEASLALLGGLYGAGKGVASAAAGLGGQAMSLAPLAAVGLPLAVGGALGYGAAKLTNLDNEDTDDLKHQELIDAYRMATQDAKIRAALQQRKHVRNQPSKAYRAY